MGAEWTEGKQKWYILHNDGQEEFFIMRIDGQSFSGQGAWINYEL